MILNMELLGVGLCLLFSDPRLFCDLDQEVETYFRSFHPGTSSKVALSRLP
jgi:hypothetical protein